MDNDLEKVKNEIIRLKNLLPTNLRFLDDNEQGCIFGREDAYDSILAYIESISHKFNKGDLIESRDGEVREIKEVTENGYILDNKTDLKFEQEKRWEIVTHLTDKEKENYYNYSQGYTEGYNDGKNDVKEAITKVAKELLKRFEDE